MKPDESLRIAAGEVQLAVRIYAAAQPVTLVLVHGYPDCAAVWDGLLPLLCQRFRVVTYDVRGAGESSAPASRQGYALPCLAADLRAVIDAVSPDQPVHLAAHDWGAVQSWEAVADPAFQSRLRSFTSVSGPCLDHVGSWIRNGLQTRSAEALKALGGQVLHSWYVWLFQLPLLAPWLWKAALGNHWHRVLAATQGIQAAPSPTQTADGVHGLELYRANIGRLVRPRPRVTRVPVQLVVPRQDDFVGAEMAVASARPWLAQGWCRAVDAGHWLPLSHPERLAQMVGEFVDLHEGGPESEALKLARLAVAGPADASPAMLSGA